MHHFRNYYCYIPSTRRERVRNTVELFPSHVDMTQTSPEDRLTQATKYLLTVLKNTDPRTPFLYQGDKTSDAINKLQSTFQPPQRDDTSKTSSPPRVTVKFDVM